MNNTYSLPSISQQLGGPLPPPQGAPHMPHTSQGHHTAHLSQPSRPSMSGPTTQPQTMTQPTVAHPWELQGTYAGKKYQLLVEQQPLRARMCGFGDKDRRPITPPPCVKVLITALSDGSKIQIEEMGYQQFVLHVELWNEDGTREVSMVKHTSSAASVNSGTLLSFREAVEQSANGYRLYDYDRPVGGALPLPPHQGPNGYTPAPSAYSTPPSAAAQGYGYPTQIRRGSVPSILPRASFGNIAPDDLPTHSQTASTRVSLSHHANTACTRNLLGSVSMSASRLVDTEEQPGVWFVLQDLSVRTEGIFRLRFSFLDLQVRKEGPNGRAVSPVLATHFSDPFQVFSAKKFPGVCESTPLSRKFALQGVKIPIRKDGEAGKRGGGGKKRRRDDDDEGEDDDNDEDD